MKRFILIAILCTVSMLSAQSFGQNKVQYREFDWEFISSPHFDVYYYGDGEKFVIWFNEVAHWWTNYEDSFYDFQIVALKD